MPNLEAVGAVVPETFPIENRCLRAKISLPREYAYVGKRGKTVKFVDIFLKQKTRRSEVIDGVLSPFVDLVQRPVYVLRPVR